MKHQSKYFLRLAPLLLLVLVSCHDEARDARSIPNSHKKVHSVTVLAQELPFVDVKDSQKFLNDLKLSPLWKVEKDDDGKYRAVARSISSSDPFLEPNPNMFLMEFLSQERPVLPKKYTITNNNVGKTDEFSTFSAMVVFENPADPEVVVYTPGKRTTLDIYDFCEGKLGLNSYSSFAVSLSSKHDIYLILREQGNNKQRAATIEKLPAILKNVASVAELPDKYQVREQYHEFFSTFFPGAEQDVVLKRFPGIQGRDTFCGYFKAKPGVSYEGINIRISHPIYCRGECTRESYRIRKAEYLGSPYVEGDLLFFLIDDNAVYLVDDYDKRFGWFSGKESFDGTLEIFNAEGKVLLKTVDKFKGWER